MIAQKQAFVHPQNAQNANGKWVQVKIKQIYIFNYFHFEMCIYYDKIVLLNNFYYIYFIIIRSLLLHLLCL